MTTGELAKSLRFSLDNVQLTAKQATTNLGIICDPGHEEPWIIAIDAQPGYLRTLDYSARWAIEPMFSDFKTRGFGVEDTQIQYPDRLSRLLLVMALALYAAVSTGMWDAETNQTSDEKKPEHSTKKAGTLQSLLLYKRLAMHRPSHPRCPTSPALLVIIN